jgi:hypothetical protein
MAGWLAGWIGGVASAVAGSWINGRVQDYRESRRVHHDDLRQKVLVRLRDGIAAHIKPLVFQQQPMIMIEHAAKEYCEGAKVTEEPSRWGPVMSVPFPLALIFGPMPSSLLEDARRNHFSELMRQVDKFVREYSGYAGELHLWVSHMAKEILSASQLPAFPAPNQIPYVMHFQSAAFIYERHFRFETAALSTEEDGTRRRLKGGSYTFAAGNAQQIGALIEILNGLMKSEEGQASMLTEKASTLQAQFNELSGQIDLAIDIRRLHGRCDLVTFF